jgi:excisionase family DNA binding protein
MIAMESKGALLRVADVAERLGTTEKAIREKIGRRQIEFVRIRKSIRFRPEAIEKIIEKGIVPAIEED